MKIKDIITYLNSENLNPNFIGDDTIEITGFSSLKNYKQGTFTWVKNEKSLDGIKTLEHITLIISQRGLDLKAPNVIYIEQSKQAFFGTVEYFYGEQEMRPAIGQGTYIGEKVKLGNDVCIGHNCVLDGDITIGDDTIIWNNVTIINKVNIGERCEIQSQTSIGHDGFGYSIDDQGKKYMVKHFGGVTIGDDVFIGPNVVIDRGTIDNTLINSGSKIDGLCFIAHNVKMGNGCTLITGSKLYGSVILGENVYIASSIIRNQCKIGGNSIVGMGSVVTKDVKENTIVIGNPAKEFVK